MAILPITLKFLEETGIRIPRNTDIDDNTRIIHDMREHLDNIRDMFWVMEEKYNIKINWDDISKFFPKGFLDNYLYGTYMYLPFIKRRFERKYPPLTIGMIQNLLISGHL